MVSSPRGFLCTLEITASTACCAYFFGNPDFYNKADDYWANCLAYHLTELLSQDSYFAAMGRLKMVKKSSYFENDYEKFEAFLV